MTRVEPSNPAGDMLFLRQLLLFASQLLSITPTVAWQARVLEVTKMCLIKCLSFVFFSRLLLWTPSEFLWIISKMNFVRAQQWGLPVEGCQGSAWPVPLPAQQWGLSQHRAESLWGTGATPALHIWYLPGNGLRPGWALAGWGQVGLGCGLTGTGADGPGGLTWGQELWDGLVKEGLLVPWALDTFQSFTRPNFVLKMCKIYSLAQ